MAGEWEKFPLGELYDFSSGLSKPRSEFGFGHGFLSFKDVFYNYFAPPKLEQLVNSTEKEQQSCSIKRGDVFLTRTSETMEELGMSCVALCDYERATFNGFTKRLRPKSSAHIIPEYAGYYFRSPSFRREVTAMSSLSTRASLNNEMLGRLTMVLPPPSTQEKIGSVLKAVDDKIELNRRMNATLEAMARALFQSWFVDFDPVRAKLDGRPPANLDPATAALFPSSFDEPELGHIPRGWIAGNFGKVVAAERERIGESDAVVLSAVASSQLVRSDEHFNKQVYSKSISNYLKVRRWDFAYNPSRINIGSIGMLKETFIGAVSPVYEVFRPKAAYHWFVERSLAQADTKGWIQTLCSGSVRQSLKLRDLESIPLVVPPLPIVQAFNKTWEQWHDLIQANKRESRTLASLRDTLLRKLLSGELSVSHIKKQLETQI